MQTRGDFQAELFSFLRPFFRSDFLAFLTALPVRGELPVTRRLRSEVLLEGTFWGQNSGCLHGYALFLCCFLKI
jgi:hypothetical protein